MSTKSEVGVDYSARWNKDHVGTKHDMKLINLFNLFPSCKPQPEPVCSWLLLLKSTCSHHPTTRNSGTPGAPHMDAKATFSIGMRLRRTDKALIFEATGAFVHREERLRCGELIREKKEKWLWLRLKCKVTVGVKVHLKQMWWPQTNALSLSLLSDSSFFNGGVRTTTAWCTSDWACLLAGVPFYSLLFFTLVCGVKDVLKFCSHVWFKHPYNIVSLFCSIQPTDIMTITEKTVYIKMQRKVTYVRWATLIHTLGNFVLFLSLHPGPVCLPFGCAHALL